MSQSTIVVNVIDQQPSKKKGKATDSPSISKFSFKIVIVVSVPDSPSISKFSFTQFFTKYYIILQSGNRTFVKLYSSPVSVFFEKNRGAHSPFSLANVHRSQKVFYDKNASRVKVRDSPTIIQRTWRKVVVHTNKDQVLQPRPRPPASAER